MTDAKVMKLLESVEDALRHIPKGFSTHDKLSRADAVRGWPISGGISPADLHIVITTLLAWQEQREAA